MLEAYIYDGLRTPFGRHAGALAPVRPDDLLAHTVHAVVERNAFEPAAFEDVIAGCTNQAGEDARNVARHAGLLAGLPIETAGMTVNRLCGSGLAAIVAAARAVTCGEGELFMTGGVESMSRAPFVLGKAESAYSRNARMFDSTIGPRFPNPKIVERFTTASGNMPETAENVAQEYAIARDAADRFALASQERYQNAKKQGFYDGELLAVDVPTGRKTPPATVAEDEHPRADTSAQKLARLRPLYPDGVVTAGNASGVNDGACALIVGSRAAGDKAGARPRARIVAAAVAGVEPRLMGLGPVPSSQKVLERAGLGLADMDVIELNEAFASQVLGCLKLLNIDPQDERLNPNGGAIAIGHPLGASGARLTLTALRQLERIQGRYALVTMCIGVGQGIAAVIERMA